MYPASSDTKEDQKGNSDDSNDLSSELHRVHFAEAKDTVRVRTAPSNYHEEKCSVIVEGHTRDDFVQPSVEQIAIGIRIVEMSMREYGSSTVLWRGTAFSRGADSSSLCADTELQQCFQSIEMKERISKQILQCKAVSRDICFSSVHSIQKFRMQTKVFFHGNCIEEWSFYFGYVIPGSVNTWQQVIEAAPSMIPAEELSGKVIFETQFFDGETLLCRSRVRVYYV
jgi:retinal rod rhodopsin-sensitive cGMP 3',5'-cyclic phosphodiesterase subunit delta